MIDFLAFSNELQKIAQYADQLDPNRKGKLVGGAVGAGVGAAAAGNLAKKAPNKVRVPVALLGALTGGLGGREIGEGTMTAGRGLRATAAQTRYAMS